LIDTVERKFTDEYFSRIDDILSGRQVDYLVVNHVEPDHSGSIKALKDKYPEISIVGNKKTFPMLENFYGEFSHKITVDDGDMLDLGKHKLISIQYQWSIGREYGNIRFFFRNTFFK
jgi:flavorubredoxin